MTKYTDDSDNHFNSFISNSVQELKKDNTCYAYTMEQVEIIEKAIYKKLKKRLIVEKNECGYTLKLKKENKK